MTGRLKLPDAQRRLLVVTGLQTREFSVLRAQLIADSSQLILCGCPIRGFACGDFDFSSRPRPKEGPEKTGPTFSKTKCEKGGHPGRPCGWLVAVRCSRQTVANPSKLHLQSTRQIRGPNESGNRALPYVRKQQSSGRESRGPHQEAPGDCARPYAGEDGSVRGVCGRQEDCRARRKLVLSEVWRWVSGFEWSGGGA